MKVRSREVKPHIDNMLSITNDARIMSADARMLIPSAPSSPESKISQCADKIHEIWKETANKRLTQITFSDIGTPKKNQFNVYHELRRQCIERGIPAEEIEFNVISPSMAEDFKDINTNARKLGIDYMKQNGVGVIEFLEDADEVEAAVRKLKTDLSEI
jgi:hypothetical protein